MLNPHFTALNQAYIFPLIEKKLEELKSTSPEAQIINLGIGDVALPLAPSLAKAIGTAALEMATLEGLRGYASSNGYDFLRNAIHKHTFAHLRIDKEAIFISDGINSDVLNILDLFDLANEIGIPNPTYPAYLNSSILRGHHSIVELPCLEENQFTPLPPKKRCRLIYLCSPSNPTGVAMTRQHLERWVDYALEQEALILFDAAYEAFITSRDVPKSIFEIEGAKECAIEFHSFSKSAGFTGLRCGYTVLPHTLKVNLHGEKKSLLPFWERRQSIKSNGVAYPIQRAAEAVYSKEGHQETKAQVATYLAQGARLKKQLISLGLTCYGGTDSPYIWVKNPDKKSSWEFFESLLKNTHILSIPGCGFGSLGEGFIRLSTFTTPEKMTLALERLRLYT